MDSALLEDLPDLARIWSSCRDPAWRPGVATRRGGFPVHSVSLPLPRRRLPHKGAVIFRSAPVVGDAGLLPAPWPGQILIQARAMLSPADIEVLSAVPGLDFALLLPAGPPCHAAWVLAHAAPSAGTPVCGSGLVD